MGTSLQLLKTAADIVGGVKQLAERLQIGERLLLRIMEGKRAVPDFVLLRAVDVVLQERQARVPPRVEPETGFRDGAQ
jgi:hypothetical protein